MVLNTAMKVKDIRLVSGVKRCRPVSDVKRCRPVSGVKRCRLVSGVKRCRPVSDVKRCRLVSGVNDAVRNDVKLRVWIANHLLVVAPGNHLHGWAKNWHS
ncbi:predicted protein [Lichtheimia corymbifera JMRC:FSU:9682]|uniref:Uncharacterized protein n=1 Tax=Lichtheimia corymbifera JMRC:FSU:9682 TaxID=1263082 RepID=A0A068RYN2_9FUNG|nr:predicted protein [Lichtheimia corymbifera JMRC:FSU:9682]